MVARSIVNTETVVKRITFVMTIPRKASDSTCRGERGEERWGKRREGRMKERMEERGWRKRGEERVGKERTIRTKDK